METSYNINKLDQLMDSIFKKTLIEKKEEGLKSLLSDLIKEKTPSIVDDEDIELLSNYSSETIRLITEKKLVLSIENEALASRKSYWDVLKKRGPKINSIILSHYFDKFINNFKKEDNVIYMARTIDEINKTYNSEIDKTFDLFNENVSEIINNASSVTLDHMENLNANGRIVSIKENNNEKEYKKGGLFLSKNSNIEYGKFVNKEEFLGNLEKLKSLPDESVAFNKKEKVEIEDLKLIIGSLNQVLKINKNNKITNQDARIISVGQEDDKKVGSLFLGNNDISLENGEYVSIDEMSLAVNKFLNEKATINEELKVKTRKGKFKQFTAVASLTLSLLAAALINKKPDVINYETTKIENSGTNLDMESISLDTLLNKDNEIAFEPQIVEKEIEKDLTIFKDESKESLLNLEEDNEFAVMKPIGEDNNNIMFDNINDNVQTEKVVAEDIKPMQDNIALEIPEEKPVISENKIIENTVSTDENLDEIESPVVSSNEIEIQNPGADSSLLVNNDLVTGEYIEGTMFQATPYTIYTPEEIYQLAAIVGGEDNGSFEGALAVASVMCNRADINNSDPLNEAKQPGQFCAYKGDWYNSHINGEIPEEIMKAVATALAGFRNTTAHSFRGVGSDIGLEIGTEGKCNKYFNFNPSLLTQEITSGKQM